MYGFQQVQGVYYVGLDEGIWVIDGVIDVVFGGKIQYCVWLVFGQQVGYQSVVVDVILYEYVVWVVVQVGQGFQVVGVGQCVEVDDFDVVCDGFENEVIVNEFGIVGDKLCGYYLFF